jgi:hypothetical protein
MQILKKNKKVSSNGTRLGKPCSHKLRCILKCEDGGDISDQSLLKYSQEMKF